MGERDMLEQVEAEYWWQYFHKTGRYPYWMVGGVLLAMFGGALFEVDDFDQNFWVALFGGMALGGGAKFLVNRVSGALHRRYG